MLTLIVQLAEQQITFIKYMNQWKFAYRPINIVQEQ